MTERSELGDRSVAEADDADKAQGSEGADEAQAELIGITSGIAGRFFLSSKAAALDPGLSAIEHRVLSVLEAVASNDRRIAVISMRRLAEILGCHMRTAQRALNGIETHGYVRTLRRRKSRRGGWEVATRQLLFPRSKASRGAQRSTTGTTSAPVPKQCGVGAASLTAPVSKQCGVGAVSLTAPVSEQCGVGAALSYTSSDSRLPSSRGGTETHRPVGDDRAPGTDRRSERPTSITESAAAKRQGSARGASATSTASLRPSDEAAASASHSPSIETASDENGSAGGTVGSVEREAETPRAWLLRQAARRFGDDVVRNRFASLELEVVGPDLVRVFTATQFECDRLTSLYQTWLSDVLRRRVEIIARSSKTAAPAGGVG